ncbi:MAG: MlaD family protein [Steroidobacteraceae bacterium]
MTGETPLPPTPAPGPQPGPGPAPAAVPRTATTWRKTRWPGWIWAIPIAAIGIVVWLMLRALSSRGIDVTLVLADAAGMSDNNTQVLYKGLEVGTVSALRLAPDGRRVIAQLDVDGDMSPYIRAGTKFYVEGAHPSFSDPSSLKALISGPTIELVPGPGKPARHFVGIEGSPPGSLAAAVPYVVTFEGAVGGIEPGSPVMLGGFRVGDVERSQLATDARTGTLATRAVLRLDPTLFHIEGASGSDARRVMNAALAALVRNGLRAGVTQTPPLLGNLEITLEMRPDAPAAVLGPPAKLGAAAGYPSIPVIQGGGLEALSRKLSRVPIEQIAENVRAITARLKSLSASPQLDDSLRHLDRTLAVLDRTAHAAGPQIAPTLRSVRETVGSLRSTAAEIDSTAAAARAMMQGSAAAPGSSLQQTLQQLTNAARSIRELADYLDQHPEALLRGR